MHDRYLFKQIADRVSAKLLADLKANKIEKIDIDDIRKELALETECPRDAEAFDELEEMTTRALVSKV